MSRRSSSLARLFRVALAVASCIFLVPAAYSRQSQNPPAKPDADEQGPESAPKPKPPEPVTIRIEVTGGEKDKPIENASIYVRYKESHRFKGEKSIEMNVKTSVDGKVRVPLVPKGKILIQVIAEGWKTYGRYFDLTDDGQVFKIHLDRPARWY
ncbi:MAG TPA: hypothetical protein VEG63_01470 [Candidatus Acidoferrales bacterium]|nr:hypothetical protein [Candidatus Acidoferrales bacterium]